MGSPCGVVSKRGFYLPRCFCEARTPVFHPPPTLRNHFAAASKVPPDLIFHVTTGSFSVIYLHTMSAGAARFIQAMLSQHALVSGSGGDTAFFPVLCLCKTVWANAT